MNKPRIYLHCNGAKSRLDDPIAYDFSVKLEGYLSKNNPEYTTIRLLPTGNGVKYADNLRAVLADPNASVNVFIKCQPANNSKKARTRLLLKSCSIDNTPFPAKLFSFLEFYLNGPMWAVELNQPDYRMVKRGITPVTLDLGNYTSVDDTVIIRKNFDATALALSRALAHYFDNLEYRLGSDSQCQKVATHFTQAIGCSSLVPPVTTSSSRLVAMSL